MVRKPSFSAIAVAATVLAACAQSPAGDSSQLASAAKPVTGGGPTLSAEELELDCRKLTGRMQVRLLELRSFANRSRPSGLSESVSAATKTVWGETSSGINDRYAQDRAQLLAYNRRLAELKCATFDIDAELAKRISDPTPTPTIPAP